MSRKLTQGQRSVSGVAIRQAVKLFSKPYLDLNWLDLAKEFCCLAHLSPFTDLRVCMCSSVPHNGLGCEVWPKITLKHVENTGDADCES